MSSSEEAGRRLVVLTEAADQRIIRAARRLLGGSLATPVLVDDAERIRQVASQNDLSVDDIRIADPRLEDDFDAFVEAAGGLSRPIDASTAKRLLRRPLMYGAMMVRLGRADAMIAGAAVPTGRVIQAGLMILGTGAGISRASSYFLIRLPAAESRPERRLIFADCAVNIEPDAAQLADIAIASAATAAQVLDEPPSVAMLSFSSKGSAQHESVDKVIEATELVKSRRPDIVIDGELQFDAAFSPRVASLKVGDDSPVAGKANVFIFPDLNSGNLAYKIAQYLAGATAIGPMLQGFAYPISDLSRGATVDDVVENVELLLATSA